MDLEDLKNTDIWELYEKGLNFMRMRNVFTDTDRNYHMYNGDQWYGLKVEGIEKVQYNFIETIVNYKTSTINENLWSPKFSSENFENREFRKTAEKVCELLDKKASKVWEKDQMDDKIREVSDDSAINDEGIIYVTYDEKKQNPLNEILDKNNVQYGNEQSSDIQSQPYIIISQRKPIIEVQEMARNEGVSDSLIKYIVGDNETYEQSGEDAKYEKDDMCTIVTKMWKEKGTVWFAKAVQKVNIIDATDSNLTLYPIAHFVWNNKKGNARGEGELRNLSPNQLELNKTFMRICLTVKQCAYSHKVVNKEKVINPSAINKVGGIIEAKGATEDVSKIFTYIQPSSMSTDVKSLVNDIITITRELKNAGDIATGGINPEQASGRAILAIQNASKQPMNKQATRLKRFIEDLARIWLDMWTVYTPEGMKLEEDVKDSITGEKYTQLVSIPPSVLEKLNGTVKVDITPTSPYDKYAQELSLENLLKGGYFSVQKIGETRKYAEALPDDATMPKQKILDICDKVEEEQQKIAEINTKSQIMQQRANQFLNNDLDAQKAQLIEAEQNLNNQVLEDVS